MNVINLIERIADFKLGLSRNGSGGRFLRDCDPEAADELNKWWDRYGPHGSIPDLSVITSLFNAVEDRVKFRRNGSEVDV